MVVIMINYKDIVAKLKRRASKEEWVNGVNQYVNSTDFEQLYTEQINKAIENYKKAGAPETWAIKQSLKLKLVSADDWKAAITAQGVADKYYNDLISALDRKAKYFVIPAQQDNLIMEILDTFKVNDTKRRMLTAYDVGQHFEKLVLYKLGNDTNNYNNEKNALINTLIADHIVPNNNNAKTQLSQLIDARVYDAVKVLTS